MTSPSEEFRADPAAAVERLVARALQDIARAETAEQLEEARVRYVGRKAGLLTELVKLLPALPDDQRRAAGAAVNRAKGGLESALDARAVAIASAAGAREHVDLTMPARRQWRGAVHPVTRVIDE